MPVDPLTGGIMTGLGVGANLLQGWMGSNAAEKAAQQQAEAQRAALAFSQQVYDESKDRFAPYLGAGAEGLGRLEGLVSGMQAPQFDYQQPEFQFDKYKDPNAQYLIDQAMKAINSSAVAKGGLGGGAVSAINSTAGNLGNQAFQGSFQRHMDLSKMKYGQAADQYARQREFQNAQIGANQGLAGMGVGAANTLGGMGQAQGQYGANMMQGIGASQAMGTANSAGSMMQGIGGAWNELGGGLGKIFGLDWGNQQKKGA